MEIKLVYTCQHIGQNEQGIIWLLFSDQRTNMAMATDKLYYREANFVTKCDVRFWWITFFSFSFCIDDIAAEKYYV